MRIAFVTPEYVTEPSFDGGLANYVARVTGALAAAGHEPVVIVAADEAAEFLHEGVRVIRAPAPTVYERVPLVPGSLYRPRVWFARSHGYRQALAVLHAKHPVDLVQYASYGGTGMLRLSGIPAVVRVSSYHRALLRHYDVEPSPATRLEQLMESIGIRRADRVFAPSHLLARQVGEASGRVVEVIESPLPWAVPDDDTRVYDALLSECRYLLFFGSLGVLKGVATIARVLRPLLERHADLRFVLVGKDVGWRGAPMIDFVRREAGAVYAERVLHLGQLPQAQLRPIVRRAVAAVLPSRIDNLPNACIEAMAAGRIVIGTRGTSFDQLIVDGRSGLLVAPDDPPALLAAMERVLTMSAAEIAAMQTAARAAVARLEPARIVERLVEFYRQTISGIRER